MATNKVVYSGRTLIDLTRDTVTEETLLRGYTAKRLYGSQSRRDADCGNSICRLSGAIFVS